MTKGHLLQTVCASALLAAAVPAYGQDADRPAPAVSADDIIVTATRREQRLQEVPLAVSAINTESLRQKSINNVSDLGPGRIPGLTVMKMFGVESSVNLNFRGQGTSDSAQGTQDAPAAFYIDGINYPRAQGTALDLITPERIEVLRGPQGQLFGRNAETGAVQVISKRPTGELGGELTLGYGNFNQRKAKGRLELPQIGPIRLQLSGFYRARDGYIKNPKSPAHQNFTPFETWDGLPFNGIPYGQAGSNASAYSEYSSFKFKQGDYNQDMSRLKTYGGRVAAEADLGSLNIFYTYDNTYTKDDQSTTFLTNAPSHPIANPSGFDAPVVITSAGGTYTPTPAQSTVLAPTYGVDSIVFETPLGNSYPDSLQYPLMNIPFITKSRGHSLTLTYDVSDSLVVKSITGYRQVIRQGGNSALSASVSALGAISTEYVNSKAFSQEFQAIYTGNRVDLTVGAIYFHEKVKDERDAWLSGNCLRVLFVGDTPGCTVWRPGQIDIYTRPYQLFGASRFFRQQMETDAYSLYGQLTYNPPILDDRLELIVGARYSDDKKVGARTINSGVVLATPITNLNKESRIDPAVAVKFQVADDVNVYARYATGYRDGGANVRSRVFNSFGVEELESIELGMKAQFINRRVTLNVALFQNTLKGHQASLQTELPANPTVTDSFNTPVDEKTKGIEVELTARPTDRLTLSVNYTYLDNPPTSFLGVTPGVNGAPPTFFIPNGTADPLGFYVPDAATIANNPGSTIFGLEPVGAPKHAGSFAATYEIPVGDTMSIVLNGDWSLTSTMRTTPQTSVLTSINSTGTDFSYARRYIKGVTYNAVNARVALQGIKIGGAEAELSLWGKNLFNTINRSFSFSAGNAVQLAGTPSDTNPYTPARVANYLDAPRTFGIDLRLSY